MTGPNLFAQEDLQARAAKLEDELDKANVEIQRLREILGFYAEPATYAGKDFGAKARAALAGPKDKRA